MRNKSRLPGPTRVWGKWLEKPPPVRTCKLMCVDEAGDGLQKLKPRRHTRMKE